MSRNPNVTLGCAGAAALEIMARKVKYPDWYGPGKRIKDAASRAYGKAKARRLADAEAWIVEVRSRRA